MWSRGVDKSGRAVLVVVCLATMLAIAGTDCQAQWEEHTDGTYNYWALNSVDKFRWEIATHQWCHWSTQGGTWKTLSTPGIDWSNIYDGAWRAMGYGLTYRYDQANNYGFFAGNTSYRFHYRYGPGQWYTSGCGGGWYKIGPAGFSADVLGDGGTYDLGGGVRFRYAASTDFGFYYNNFAYRFYYRYNPGQWYTSGYNGGWYTIGAAGTCANVLSDGGWYNLGNGTWFRYNAASDYGFYGGDGYRFYYRYTSGQWYTSGVGGGWTLLGNAGRTAVSLFDGVFQDLGNGWSFGYQGSLDLGTYVSNLGTCNFSYDYALGQWAHKGFVGGWGNLGYSSSSVSFVGDGARHGATNGWLYSYDYGEDAGLFFYDDSDTALRFSYAYGSGIWSHHDNSGGAGALSTALSLSDVAFIGEGWNEVSIGQWYYFYDYGANTGLWARQSGGSQQRFSYDYVLQQWAHYGDDGGAADLGGPTSLSIVTFMGDENRHATPFLFDWWYSYNYGGDRGQFFNANDDTGLRFSYLYQTGVWDHHDANGGEGVLSESLSLTNVPMIGEGFNQVSATPFWYYDYDYGADTGYWELEFAGPRFSYDYVARQWTHYGDDGGAAGLGSPTSLSSVAFMGDEGRHQILSGWWYSYNYGSDRGQYFTDNSDSALRFSYDYVPGTWNHHDAGGGWGVFTKPLSLSDTPFIGAEGVYTDISSTSVPWYYSYSQVVNTGYWAHGSDGSLLRFQYGYIVRQWRHYDGLGGITDLGIPTSLTETTFMGDGTWHNISSGLPPDPQWYYAYAYDIDPDLQRGGWSRVPGPDDLRFAYFYNQGYWAHIGLGGVGAWFTNPPNAISLSVLAFMGDGAPHGGTNYWYSYNYGADMGEWARSDTLSLRFTYAYDTGIWSHHDVAGGEGELTGPVTLQQVPFIGVGWNQVAVTGPWYYGYNWDADTGFWSRVPDGAGRRFSYKYDSGEWRHYDSIGGSGVLASTGGLALAPYDGSGGPKQVSSAPDWWYVYLYEWDAGHWARNEAGTPFRFAYYYDSGNWFHHDDTEGFDLLASAVPLSTVSFIGAEGVYTQVSATAVPWYYTYNYTDDTGYWAHGSDDSLQRFSYDYADRQWWHYDGLGGSTDLGIPTSLSMGSFMGDGAWHNISSGLPPDPQWYYHYVYDPDPDQQRGVWSLSTSLSDNRFAYFYNQGYWAHIGLNGVGSWFTNPPNPISLSDLAFMGDGDRHGGTSWWYSYNYDLDRGQWERPVTYSLRFTYAYETGIWSHHDVGGGEAVIGEPVTLGQVPFIGVGWHADNVDENLWWYSYDYGADRGLWDRSLTGDGSRVRFSYAYTTGQWGHIAGVFSLGSGSLGEAILGDTTNLSAMRFIGLYAAQHIVFGPFGWWYGYDYSQDGGGWGRVDPSGPEDIRFGYNYEYGTWGHKEEGSLVFAILGASTGSRLDAFTSFVGGGLGWGQVDSSPDWYYWYRYSDDTGFWARDAAGADLRFSYCYQTSGRQWLHYDYAGEHNVIGAPVSLASVGFMGDSGWYADNLDTNNWYYSYDYGGDRALWGRDGGGSQVRFSYEYTSGQWGHIAGVFSDGASSLGEALLGDTTNLSAMRFIGLFTAQQIVSGTQPWWYGYDYSQDGGGWSQVDPDTIAEMRFGYNYTYGTWGHKAFGAPTMTVLGALTGSRLDEFDSFAGDGTWGRVNGSPVWYYAYNYTSDIGSWARAAEGVDLRFAYVYGTGQWYHGDSVGGSNVIGAPVSLGTVGFIGDGGWYADNLDTNNWYYSYDYGGDRALWSRDGGGSQVRFSYAYTSGQWGHIAGVFSGGSGSLGEALLGDPTDLSAMRFIGLYTAQQITSAVNPYTWWYGYDYGQDGGGWSQVDPDTIAEMRFGYNYTYGTWGHKAFGAPTMTVLGALTGSRLDEFDSFAGDGGWGKVNTGPDWYYRYDYGSDTGFWALADEGVDLRFSYAYSDSQWWHHGWNGGEAPICSPTSLGDLAFMGDGEWHEFSGVGVWHFKYLYGEDRGYWAWELGVTKFNQFSYSYDDGQWRHYNTAGGEGPLANGWAISLSDVAFVGDGASPLHQVGAEPWYYYYNYLQHTGHWTRSANGADSRLIYEYNGAGWYWYDYLGFALGSYFITADISTFVGDAQPHASTYGLSYKYTYTGDFAEWLLTATLAPRFRYAYDEGRWGLYQAAYGNYAQISSPNQYNYFIGDGARHTTISGACWDVQYTGDVLYIRHLDTASGTNDYVGYFFAGGYWADASVTYPGPWQMSGYAVNPSGAFGTSSIDFWRAATYRMNYHWEDPIDPSTRVATYYLAGALFRLYDYYWGEWYTWTGSFWDYTATGDPGLMRP